jgi:hypothetical protein
MTATFVKRSSMQPVTSRQALRLGFWLWLMGMPGVISLVWLLPPTWLGALALESSDSLARVVVAAAIGLLLALAVWLGVMLGTKVGLGTPLLTAAMQGRTPWRGIRFLSLPGVAGGVIGAALLVTLAMLWPESLAVIDPVYNLPWLTKILYGGITGELLMRFGILSLVMWLLWKTFGNERRLPSWRMGWAAVILSAMLAGALPVYFAWTLSQSMTFAALLPLAVCEVVYGLLAGVLFWRYGLESAMLAHVLTYVLSHGLI